VEGFEQSLSFIIKQEKEMNGMIIIVTGASHTGKTVLAQRMLEKY